MTDDLNEILIQRLRKLIGGMECDAYLERCAITYSEYPDEMIEMGDDGNMYMISYSEYLNSCLQGKIDRVINEQQVLTFDDEPPF